MAVDFRQDRKSKLSRCRYYKAIYVNSNRTLKQDAVCQGIFYAKDSVPFTNQSVNLGNVMIKQTIGSLETKDFIPDLEERDFVEYGGELYIVDRVIPDDENRTKQFSSRPSATTNIQVRR